MVLAQVRQVDYAVKVDQSKMQLAQAKGSLESALACEAEAAFNQARSLISRAKISKVRA
jgi:hypothetical protein